MHDSHSRVRSPVFRIKLAVDAAKNVVVLVQPCRGLDDESFDAFEIDGEGEQRDERVLRLKKREE